MKDYFELPEVLLAELESIDAARGRPQPKTGQPFPAREESGERADGSAGESEEQQRRRRGTCLAQVFAKLQAAELTALCLSGGGIRSATFGLGVLQALAKNGILRRIDYLSTVSGGGYIGSWLSSWIARESGGSAAPLDDVNGALARHSPALRCHEPSQVRFLRDYSNYLTPRIGALSIDTWAILGTYLRNLVLNWLVLMPLFFAFLLLPRLAAALIVWTDGTEALALLALLALGALLGLLPIAYTVVDLPGIGNLKLSKGRFVLFFLVPLLLMACLLSAYWARVYRHGCTVHDCGRFVLFGLLVHLLGWTLGFLWLRFRKRVVPAASVISTSLGAAALTGMVAGLLGWAAATKLVPKLLMAVHYPKLIYATLCVPIVLMVYLLTGALMVAVLSRFTGDDDREWWGRSAGVIILACLVWTGLMALVIYGPWLILPESQEMWKRAYAAVGALSGVAAALFGKSSATPALRPGAPVERLRTSALSIAAALFLVLLIQVVSLLASVLFWLHPFAAVEVGRCRPDAGISCLPVSGSAPAGSGFGFDSHLGMICNTSLSDLVLVAAVAALAGFVMAVFVNANKFSMHAMYRNRLVRCYLGASRAPEERRPNPFTGFDSRDDLPMADLPKRPYHVVNMAWNLVKGKRLAWQQRKAASFIMTPLFAGGDLDAVEEHGVLPGGYRSIDQYGALDFLTKQPITLGTALAISGAAVSPNMGYHSSPLVTFVMALFNVRLGWWLGNPGKNMGGAWRKASPWLAVRPLLSETFGFSREQSRSVYLSDGGHFENLALYEMVRRRCRYIIVCDSGCDGRYTFEDLGNAVRKVRADFGIEIEINLTALLAKKAHFAVGTVWYSRCDKSDHEGTLLYIKPVLTNDEPVDIFNYGQLHPEFPHESTADQWFDEAQFESYRKLGLHSLEELLAGDWSELSVQDLMKKAKDRHDSLVEKLRQERASGATRS